MLTLDEIAERLREIVGPRRVSTNPIDKINYQHTLAYGAYRALPDVIVRIESDPAGNHKVAEILQFANEHKIPIVAKGGVGMGISSPLKGGLLLDMLGMDKILEVNSTMQYVIAEGGASVYAIHHALSQHGLMLPNFGTYGPAVVIGAMINKGGIGYGMTRYGWIADMVLGLEVILANGETIRLGALANQGTTFGPFQKWIHLPDLLGLFTLAAGSMGIISKVCLRAIECRARVAARLLLCVSPRSIAEVPDRSDGAGQRRSRLRHPFHRPLAISLADGRRACTIKARFPTTAGFF